MVGRTQASKPSRGRALRICTCIHKGCSQRFSSSNRGKSPVVNEAKVITVPAVNRGGRIENRKRMIES